MQIVTVGEGQALCAGPCGPEPVDMRLVGDQPVGAWVYVHRQTAREVLTAAEGLRIVAALEALEILAAGGEPPPDAFADLTDRAPELPEHLRTQTRDVPSEAVTGRWDPVAPKLKRG